MRDPGQWYGPELAKSGEWLEALSAAELDELDAAIDRAQDRHADLLTLTQADFPLPTLAPRLAKLAHEIVWGRGFVLLRGLPVADWGRERAAWAYYGLGLHLGDPVPQNAMGHLLGHVKDLGKDPTDPQVRIYQTSYRQLFHTDSCDVVGLLCLQPAKEGGRSAIVSSVSIFREIEKRRPELAAVLQQPFTIDRKGEVPAGKASTYRMAIVHRFGGCLTTIYARDFIEAAQRRPEVPRLTSEQLAALDLMDELANSHDFRLDMDFRPGDMQFLHNHQILHARTAYVDWPEPERRRHLLRLWLSARNGRPLPPIFAERYGEIRVGRRRGGIQVPGQALVAPLDA
ncbi:MAG TPA: TauD/TfdA family dioxygenase [Kiloniellales bacterium]|nr:TauD/TfdA family dioxygenase [Kiloniellales bacterium]